MLPAYAVQVAIGAVLIILAALGIWQYGRTRPAPDEIERRRRLAVNRTGKLGVGEIVDMEGSMILYSYVVAGVHYSNSQDVSSLEALLPMDRMQILGHVGIKFNPRIPANSIVICEEWSGIGRRRS
jgi:hypothetical protein